MYKRTSVRLRGNFSTEAIQGRMQWNGLSKVLKEKDRQPGILNPPKLSLKNEGEFKTF